MPTSPLGTPTAPPLPLPLPAAEGGTAEEEKPGMWETNPVQMTVICALFGLRLFLKLSRIWKSLLEDDDDLDLEGVRRRLQLR